MEEERPSRIPRLVHLRPVQKTYASMYLQQRQDRAAAGEGEIPSTSASDLKNPTAKASVPRSLSGGDFASPSSALLIKDESQAKSKEVDLELIYRRPEELESTPEEEEEAVMVPNEDDQFTSHEYIRISRDNLTASHDESSEDEGEIELNFEKQPVTRTVSLKFLEPLQSGFHVPEVIQFHECGGDLRGTIRLWNLTDMNYGFQIMMNDAATGEYNVSPDFGSIQPYGSQDVEFTVNTPGYTSMMAANDLIIVFGIGTPNRKLEEDTLARYLKLMYTRYPYIGEQRRVIPQIMTLRPIRPEDVLIDENLMKMFNSMEQTRHGVHNMNEAIIATRTTQKILFYFILLGVIFAFLAHSLWSNTEGAEGMEMKVASMVDSHQDKDEGLCRRWFNTC